MPGEATNALSIAILKRRYAGGKLPKAHFAEFPAYASCEKKEDFVGDDYALALQTENPQGVGTTVANAQNAAAQGNYRRFLLSRLEYFGVARIKGQALRTATTRGDGALVDLWVNEMDGIQKTILKMLEIFFFGTGNGVLATIASGHAGTTWTLTVAEDVNNIDVGMKVRLVNDTSYSPTVRITEVTVTQVNRSAGTVTVSGAVAGAVSGDSIVRSGDQATSGSNNVPAGLRKWLEGGNAPGTWKGMDRNEDPVRTASQALDMTGLPMAEAITDLESLITTQGHTPKKRLIAHPRDFRQVKKTLFGKVQLSSGGGSPTIGFNGANWAGDGGEIATLQSPFCPKTNVILKDMSTFFMCSAGPAPQPLDFDKSDFLRLASDDAYEVRYGLYGEFGERMPVNSARGTNWGV
jgi:hypothetical protein